MTSPSPPTTPAIPERLIVFSGLNPDRKLIRAKRNTGLRTTLRGSYGTTNASPTLGGVYEEPENQQTLRLSVNIPILDWGKSASAVKLAESRRELELYGVEREKLDFERQETSEVVYEKKIQLKFKKKPKGRFK